MKDLKVATWNISGINGKPFEFENKKDYPGFFDHVDSFGKKDNESKGKEIISTIIEEIPETLKERLKNSTSTGPLLNYSIAEYFTHNKLTEHNRDISGIERYIGERPTILNASQNINGNYWDKLFSYLEKYAPPKGVKLTENQKDIMLLYEVVVYHIITTYLGWEDVRRGIDRSQNRNVQIYEYINGVDADIMFLQEANTSDLNMEIVGKTLFKATNPGNQTSCILISNTFNNVKNISDECVALAQVKIEAINEKSKIKFASQDLVVVTAEKNDKKYILASFHGDSTGAATNAVVDAVCEIKNTKYPKHNLIFGLDANSNGSDLTYEAFNDNLDKNNIISTMPFSKNLNEYQKKDYTRDHWTTYKTRTLLQTQIYKAGNPDQSVKDYILIDNTNRFGITKRVNTSDNKGIGFATPDIQIPNNMFPADHLIVYSDFIEPETGPVSPATNSTKLLAGFAFIPFFKKYSLNILIGLIVVVLLCLVVWSVEHNTVAYNDDFNYDAVLRLTTCRSYF